MLLPPCLFHYLAWTLGNLIAAILYVTARNASCDLGPSSPPNLIWSSWGKGGGGYPVGDEKVEWEEGGGDSGGGSEGKEVKDLRMGSH